MMIFLGKSQRAQEIIDTQAVTTTTIIIIIVVVVIACITKEALAAPVPLLLSIVETKVKSERRERRYWMISLESRKETGLLDQIKLLLEIVIGKPSIIT